MRRWLTPTLAGALAGLGLAAPAWALVTVSLSTPETTVTVGSTLDVTVMANLSDPIVGFGFDLVFDDTLLSTDGPPVIGLDWVAVPAVDGDGLAGAAFPDGLTGDVLLAVITLQANAVGMSEVAFETTPGDLTEGFAFDPLFSSGFDTIAPVSSLFIQIVPEPASGLLVVLGLIGLAIRSRPRS